MMKPVLVEKYADNGQHSHWSLVDGEGNVLWEEGNRLSIKIHSLEVDERDGAAIASFELPRNLDEWSINKAQAWIDKLMSDKT